MKDIKLDVIKTYELDPNKYYIFELPQRSFTKEDAHLFADEISRQNIRSIILVRRGDEEIKIYETSKDK